MLFEPASDPDEEESMPNIAIADFEKRIREQELSELDNFYRGTGDAPMLYRSSGLFVRASKAEGGKMTFVASEESEDRMGDIIEVAGWDTKNFEKNPVFMLMHQHNMPPLGIVSRTWVNGKQLMADVIWDDDDPLAEFIKGKYLRKIMRAVSVGFKPTEFEALNSDNPFGGIRFIKQELLELSAVPIPAHPKALQKAALTKQFMVTLSDLALPDDDPDSDPDPEADTPAPEHEDVDGDMNTDAEEAQDLGNLEDGDMKDDEEKAGAVISRANKTKLNRARALIGEVLNDQGGEDEKMIPYNGADEEIPEEEDEPIDFDAVMEAIRDIHNVELTTKEDR